MCRASIACAVIRQPSISRCGTRAIVSRSLNAPGSDSSAFTTRYFGFGLLRSISDALRPIGKPAPPRPRRFESLSTVITSSGVIPRACWMDEYPPAARYPSTVVRSCSSVPARRTLAAGIRPSFRDLRDDSVHVVGLDRMPVATVDRHHRRVPAGAQALDGAERDSTVFGCLARANSQLALERVEDALRAAERAREVRAHLDDVAPDGLQVQHVVEAR